MQSLNIFLFSAEQIILSLMLFYYVQNVYQKNMPGPRLIIITIPRVIIIRRKASAVSVNEAGESWGHSESLSKGFRGQSPIIKFLGYKGI